ncbi:MAG: hypothetical protein J0H05_10680 [Stenotrophomonas acidaminiphila]|nr:hypothetical protein [Stenotrophomonas acidaminiphila]
MAAIADPPVAHHHRALELEQAQAFFVVQPEIRLRAIAAEQRQRTDRGHRLGNRQEADRVRIGDVARQRAVGIQRRHRHAAAAALLEERVARALAGLRRDLLGQRFERERQAIARLAPVFRRHGPGAGRRQRRRVQYRHAGALFDPCGLYPSAGIAVDDHVDHIAEQAPQFRRRVVRRAVGRR